MTKMAKRGMKLMKWKSMMMIKKRSSITPNRLYVKVYMPSHCLFILSNIFIQNSTLFIYFEECRRLEHSLYYNDTLMALRADLFMQKFKISNSWCLDSHFYNYICSDIDEADCDFTGTIKYLFKKDLFDKTFIVLFVQYRQHWY